MASGPAQTSSWLRHWLPEFITGPKWPKSLLQLLAYPPLDNLLAQSSIGYEPQYHWKNSVMESFKKLSESPEMTVYRLKDDGIIFQE